MEWLIYGAISPYGQQPHQTYVATQIIGTVDQEHIWDEQAVAAFHFAKQVGKRGAIDGDVNARGKSGHASGEITRILS